MFFKNKKNKKKKKKEKKFSRFSYLGIGKERTYFIENLGMLIGSGMSVVSALDAIKNELRTSGGKNLADKIKKDVEAGYSISKALINTGLFPDHTVSLIRIGEETGRLNENLKMIAVQEQKDRALKSKVKSAMMYPVLVLLLSAGIGTGIAWFILPRLARVFSQLDMNLPWITKWLIATGIFLGEYGSIFIPTFLTGFFLLIYFVFYFSKTRFIGQGLLFSLPGINQLIKETEISRFGFLLGTLLDAGMPIVSALNSLAEATTFKKYKNFYMHLKEEVGNGNSFEKSFNSYKKSRKLIPSTIQQMIISGEKSGLFADTLIRISKTYEEKTENTTKNLTILLEPIMLIFVWCGVVAVALAVILPIYSLVGGLNEPKEINKNPSPATEKKIVDTSEKQEEIVLDEENTEKESVPKVRILQTGTGFLNVRQDPSLEAEIISRVAPEDELEIIGESEEWLQIVLVDEKKLEEDVEDENQQEETDENDIDEQSEETENTERQLGWIHSDYAELIQESL